MNFGSNFTPVSFFSPSVPPFPLNAANNGLSVDPVSFEIVLGNNTGAPGSPSQLLSDREVVTNAHTISFINANGLVKTTINTGLITLLHPTKPQIVFNTSTANQAGTLENHSGLMQFLDSTLTPRLQTTLTTGDTVITGTITTGTGNLQFDPAQPWNLGNIETIPGLSFDTDHLVEVCINGNQVLLACATLPA